MLGRTPMRTSPFPKSEYRRNAYLYKIMGNPWRLEILNILARNETSVSELAATVGLRPSAVSQHLSLLSVVKLVQSRRAGKQVYYRIVDPHILDTSVALRNLFAGKALKHVRF